MKKVVQVFDEQGQPAGGHVFQAPDEATLQRDMEAVLPPGRWQEVESEEAMVIPVTPDEPEEA